MPIVATELDTGTPTTNQTPADGAAAMFILIRCLMNAGWLHHASGNGTSFTTSPGTVPDPDANCVIASAADFRVNNSWIVLKHPDGFLLVIYRGTTNIAWRISYVPLVSGATQNHNNTPSATVAPTYATQNFLKGTASTFVNLFGSDGTYRINVVANTDDNTFWMGMWATGSGSTSAVGGFLLDKMLAGSFPTEDVDPYIWYCPSGFGTPDVAFSHSQMSSETAGASSSPKGYLRKGLTGEGFTDIPLLFLVSGSNARVLPALLGTNPHNQKDDGIPAIYARRGGLTAPVGWKGLSSVLRYNAASRSTGEPLTRTTARDRICVGDFNLYWDGSVPVI